MALRPDQKNSDILKFKNIHSCSNDNFQQSCESHSVKPFSINGTGAIGHPHLDINKQTNKLHLDHRHKRKMQTTKFLGKKKKGNPWYLVLGRELL